MSVYLGSGSFSPLLEDESMSFRPSLKENSFIFYWAFHTHVLQHARTTCLGFGAGFSLGSTVVAAGGGSFAHKVSSTLSLGRPKRAFMRSWTLSLA